MAQVLEFTDVVVPRNGNRILDHIVWDGRNRTSAG